MTAASFNALFPPLVEACMFASHCVHWLISHRSLHMWVVLHFAYFVQEPPLRTISLFSGVAGLELGLRECESQIYLCFLISHFLEWMLRFASTVCYVMDST